MVDKNSPNVFKGFRGSLVFRLLKARRRKLILYNRPLTLKPPNTACVCGSNPQHLSTDCHWMSCALATLLSRQCRSQSYPHVQGHACWMYCFIGPCNYILHLTFHSDLYTYHTKSITIHRFKRKQKHVIEKVWNTILKRILGKKRQIKHIKMLYLPNIKHNNSMCPLLRYVWNSQYRPKKS